MKTSILRFFICLGILQTFLHARELKAQGYEVFLQANKEDTEKIFGSYMKPFFIGLGNGLSNGWYNTAAPHKFPGFDLTITVNGVYIPKSLQSFKFDASEYTSIKGMSVDNGNTFQKTGELETWAGSGETDALLKLEYKGENNGKTYTVSSNIEAPDGLLEFKPAIVPVPMYYFGIGLPKNTDLKIRFLPTLKPGDDNTKVKIFGIGVMHDFKQWIPGLKAIPFDASVFVGYTKLNLESTLNDSEDAKGLLSSSATTVQVLVSKKLSVLTVYGGFGFNTYSSKFQILGTYYIDTNNGSIPRKDPLDLSYGSSGGRATLGARLKLAIITLHADYTFHKYNTLSLGFGLSVR